MKLIDLRSDTVTLPTSEMRHAMANADVGDDVYGEDPTVNKLQEMAADILGMEAGLFVPSGTMGNLAAILAHCNRGDEIILGNLAHTFLYEAGGIAALGGIHPHTLKNNKDGTIDIEAIRSAIRSKDAHFPVTKLITLENTHNRCGGAVLSLAYMEAVEELVKENNLLFHLDGARVFNAAEALGVDVKEIVRSVDSVTFCLSKGLGAPVGSVLCGSYTFIDRAHRIRKQLGGGMRQSGILAAAGIIALETIVPVLGKDHRRAKKLAALLCEIPQLILDDTGAITNMVYFNLSDRIELSAAEVAARMLEYNIKIGVVGPKRFRLVIHHWIDDDGIERTAGAIREILSK